jgi:malate dehydrogenase
VYVGVPAKLGRKGIQQVVEIELTPEQKTALHTSADHVRENCSKILVTA